jgi:hypothetical protein
MIQERRTNRSNYRDQALCLQLAACAESDGLDAMVLSDQCGLLVASSPWPRRNSENLASWLPMFAASADDSGEMACVFPDGRRLQVRRLLLGEEQLYLAALGQNGARGAAQFGRAEAGVRRILGDT